MQTALKQPLEYARVPERDAPPPDETRLGLLYGLGAYLSWGAVPM